MVRAKFICVSKKEMSLARKSIFSVKLSPIITGAAENKEFYTWAPDGNIELNNVSKCAADSFFVGKEYYVDFTKPENARPKLPSFDTLKAFIDVEYMDADINEKTKILTIASRLYEFITEQQRGNQHSGGRVEKYI